MRMLITGVGDAFTQHSFGTSAVVEGPGGFIQVDCPDPIHRALLEASTRSGWNVSVAAIHDIIITHLHGDHCNGLESFGFWRRIQRLRDPNAIRPRLHLTPQAAARVWEKLAPAMDAPMGDDRPSTLEDYFDIHIIKPNVPVSIAGLTVRCRFTKHPIPTIGLLISDGEHAFGWSSDTPFEQEHINWLNAADVIVHESNLGPSHTPIEKLSSLPKDIRDKIRLIHLPDGFDSSRTDMNILRAGDVLKM